MFGLKGEGSRFLRSIGTNLQNYMAMYSRLEQYSLSVNITVVLRMLFNANIKAIPVTGCGSP
jgi:hypothetical protein